MKNGMKNRITSGLLVISMVITSLMPNSLVKAATTPQSGVVDSGGNTTFYYQGDGTETQINVKGEFNNWSDVSLTKGAGNLWSTTVSGIQPGITAYGFYNDADNSGNQTDGDKWIKDFANPYHKAGDNPVLIYKCNPVVNQALGEIKIYYPSIDTVTPGALKIKYTLQGSSDAEQEATFLADAAYENIYSVVINNAAAGTYEYKLELEGKEVSDKYVASAQIFVVPEVMTRPDKFANNPGGNNIWRITGNVDALGGWNPSSEAGLFSHLVDNYYAKSLVLPAGDYEFKLTCNGGWDNSIGSNSGGNFTFKLTETTKANFYLKEKDSGEIEVRTNLDSLNSQGIKQYVPTLSQDNWPRLVGNLQTKIGDKADWSPSEAKNMFVDYNFDNTVYKLQVALPSGTYECKAVYGNDWGKLNYGDGGSNHSIHILDSANVVFTTSYKEGMKNDDGSIADNYVPTDSIYDGKIDKDNLYFDSRSTTYKSPFGAIRQGQEDVTFRIAAKEGDAQFVRLELTDGDGVAKTYEMGISTVYDGKDYWEVTVPKEDFNKIGVWSYKFIIIDSSIKLEYGDDGSSGGTGVTADEGQAGYNLTVYASDYHTPDWMKNAVVYQIFPDRFYDGDVSNNAAKFVDGTRGRDVQLFDGSQGSAGLWSDYPENPRQSEDKNKPYYPNAKTDGVYNNEFYGGDIEGIRKKLSYLQTLGVTAIYLNPVAWASSNHKYDATDYKHLDPMFGEPVYNIPGDKTSGLNYEETRKASDMVYENFAKVCKELGIYLISDGVFNHVGDDSIYFDRYENYPEIGAYEFWSRVWDSIEASGTKPMDATKEQIAAAKTKIMNQYKETKNSATGKNYTEDDFSYIDWFDVGPKKVKSEDGILHYEYEGWWGYDSLPVIKTVEADVDNLSNDKNATIAGSHEYNNVSYRETVIGYDLNGANISDAAKAMQESTSQKWLWMGASGWRLDVAPDVSTETWKEFRKSVKSTKGKTDVNGNTIPEPIILGEEWNVATKYLLGDTFDSVMNYQFRAALQNFIINGKDAAELNKALEIIRENYPEEAWYAMLNLVDSHDTVRNITKIDNPSWEEENIAIAPEASERSIKLQALTAIFQLSYPGAPTIYYGDEVGVTGTKDPDSRRTFPWERVTENGDKTYRISDKYADQYGDLFNAYIDAAKVRNSNKEIFATGDIQTAYAQGSVIAYARKSDSMGGMSVLNTGENAVTFEADVQEFLPDGLTLKDELGSNVTATVIDGKASITVPAMSGLMMVSTTKLAALPEAPSNLKAEAVDGEKGKVNLTWAAVVGVDGYEVYRAPLEGMTATRVYSGSDLSYIDNDVENGTRYFYYVKSVKGDQKSVNSKMATALPSFEVTNITTPTKVSDVTIEVGKKTETISTAITIPGLTDDSKYAGKDVDGLTFVLVYYRTEDGSETAKETKLRYSKDSSLAKIYEAAFEPTMKGEFTYYAKATVNHGVSYNLSSTQTINASASLVDTTAPKKPILEAILQEPNRAELKWTSDDADIKGFDILRKEEAGGPEIKVATISKDDTSYVDLSVSNGKTYKYRVAAFDQYYNRGYSDIQTVTPKITMIDVTLRLTIPERVFTSSTDTIYVAGSENGWNASGWEMKKPSGATDNNVVEYKFRMLVGKTMQYKYTRGSWDTEAFTSNKADDTTSPGNYAYSSTDTNIQLTIKNQGENKMLVEDYVLRWVDMPMMITVPRISYGKEDINYETTDDTFNLRASVPRGGIFTMNGTDINSYLPGAEKALDTYGNVLLDNIPLKPGKNTFVLHIEPTEETKNMEWLTDTGRINSQMTATKKITITRTGSMDSGIPMPPQPTKKPTTEVIQKPETTKKDQVGVSTEVITKQEGSKVSSNVIISKEETTALIEQASKSKTPVKLIIPIVSKELALQLAKENVKDADIKVTIPKVIASNNNIIVDTVKADKELLNILVSSKKQVNIHVEDEAGNNLFTWNLDGATMQKNGEKAEELNLSIHVTHSDHVDEIYKLLKQDSKNKSGIVVHLEENKNLPCGSTVRVNVVTDTSLKSGDKVYIYHYNTKTKKLDSIPKTTYKIESDGCISMNPKSGSDYVILNKPVSSKIGASLENQISTRKNVSVKKGKSSQITLNIPDTIVLTKSLNIGDIKDLDKSVMAATVTYKSSNSNILKVNSKTGKVIGKAKGSVTVTITVTLKNGKKKTFKTKVVVK